jgi:hypothetical protein
VERMLADQRRREESREKNERARVMRELEQLGNQSGSQRKLSSLSSGKKSNRKRSQEEFYR